MVVALASAHRTITPATSERRAAYTSLLAGGNLHKAVGATNKSLLGAGDSCGSARGNKSRKRNYEPFVTLLYHSHLYLAFKVAGASARPLADAAAAACEERFLLDGGMDGL